jgi:hypothetical protein
VTIHLGIINVNIGKREIDSHQGIEIAELFKREDTTQLIDQYPLAFLNLIDILGVEQLK